MVPAGGVVEDLPTQLNRQRDAHRRGAAEKRGAGEGDIAGQGRAVARCAARDGPCHHHVHAHDLQLVPMT